MADLQALGRVVLEVADQRRRELVEQKRADLSGVLNSFDDDVAHAIREWEADPGGELDSDPTRSSRAKVIVALQNGSDPALRKAAVRDFVEYEVLRDELRKLEGLPIEDIAELTVVDKYEEVFGKIPDVLAEMDRRSTLSVRFLADDSRPPSKSFRRTSEYASDGVFLRLGGRPALPFATDDTISLSVTSPSAGWARSAFARLCDEIEKGVPRWSFLRRPFWRFILAVLYFYVPWLAVLLSTSPSRETWLVSLWIPSIAFAISAISGASNRLTDWLFPAFEVTQDGAQASGTRRLAYLAGLFVTIPIGIFVNQIS